jgi:hypothetical protein
MTGICKGANGCGILGLASLGAFDESNAKPGIAAI